MGESTGEIIRRSGLAKRLRPPQVIQLEQAARQVVDVTSGRVFDEAAEPFRTPQDFQWPDGVSGRIRAVRPGILELVAAECEVAPTTGDAVIQVTQRTAAGTEVIASVTVPKGWHIRENTGLTVEVPAGAWLGYTLINANGATGISVSATMRVR
jgi:hypothetical protein